MMLKSRSKSVRRLCAAALLPPVGCLLYTSDAADDLRGVDPGGRRRITQKNIAHCRTSTIISKLMTPRLPPVTA